MSKQLTKEWYEAFPRDADDQIPAELDLTVQLPALSGHPWIWTVPRTGIWAFDVAAPPVPATGWQWRAWMTREDPTWEEFDSTGRYGLQQGHTVAMLPPLGEDIAHCTFRWLGVRSPWR